MNTDYLREYASLMDETMKTFIGITTYPIGWKLHNPEGRVKANTAAVNDLRLKWLNYDSKGIRWELENNLLSVADKDKLKELYRIRFSPKVIEDIAGIDLSAYDDCENKDEFFLVFNTLCEEFNAHNKHIADTIIPLLSETQLIEDKAPMMQITEKAIEEFKIYFVSRFKGAGNGNPDIFTENLIPTLQACNTKKEIARLAYACYLSADMAADRRPKSWNKWKDEFCKLFSIDKLPYHPDELPIPTYSPGTKYYFLKPPKNRQ